MLSQAQQERLHVSDVKGGVGVEDDDVIEVDSDVIGDLDDDLYEPSWSSAASLWH